MTITDEERREVARKLREMPCDVYELEAAWKREGIETECHDQTDYYQIHDAILGCLPAEHMHPCDYEELHSRLADLIDRPTCAMAFDRAAGMVACSGCGEHFAAGAHYLDRGAWNHCPNCGAVVVG